MVLDSDQAWDILSYILFGIGSACSIITLLLILVNYQQMVKNLYARVIFMIQLLILLTLIGSWPSITQPDQITACRAFGATFNSLFLASNCFMKILLLLIYLDLSNRRKVFKKHMFKIQIGVLVLSLVVGFAPINTYNLCYVGDYPLYCGYCFDSATYNFGLLFYILPEAIGLILCILLLRTYKRLTRNQLNRNQKQALSSIFIPSLSVILMMIHFVVKISLYSKYIQVGEGTHNQSLECGLVLLKSFIFVIPLLNLVCFLRIVGKLEEIVGIKVMRCRWAFCLPKLSEMEKDSLNSEDEFHIY